MRLLPFAAAAPGYRGTLPAVDWTTYIPSAVTGVVGLAGIGGALRQAKHARESAAEDAKANREAASTDLQVSLRQAANNLMIGINAEDKRAYVAAKRKIYAVCLTAFQQLARAAVNYRVAQPIIKLDDKRTLIEKQEAAQDNLYQAVNELILIAPPHIILLTDRLSENLSSFM